jgi:DNA-directed RNA polymerase specialized sigma24 family protein
MSDASEKEQPVGAQELGRQARPPPNRGAAPELAAVTKDQMRALVELAQSVARAITKSDSQADNIVQTTFELLLTTRRWDSKKPLEAHVVGIVRSLISHAYAKEKSTRPAQAHEGFHYENVGHHSPSPEDKTLDASADEQKQSRATRELDELAARVAKHPLAPRVLQKRVEGLTKAADIAHALDVNVEEVYRANDVLRRNLRAMRRKSGDGDEVDGDGGEETR